MNYIIDTKLDHVKELRTRVQYLKAQYKEHVDAFNAAYKDLTERITQEEKYLKDAEDSLREEALFLYHADDKKNKDIYLHLKERDMIQLKYDEDTALTWAKSHDLYLILDKRGFESYIRNLNSTKGKGIPPFVTISIKETVAIDKEL